MITPPAFRKSASTPQESIKMKDKVSGAQSDRVLKRWEKKDIALYDYMSRWEITANYLITEGRQGRKIGS